MNKKLWIALSPWWLGCGGVVDMGTVVDPASGGTSGAGAAGTGAAATGAAGAEQGPNATFEHELVQFAGWQHGMCALFSDDLVRCWRYGDLVGREVPDLRGVAVAANSSDPVSDSRVCVVERSGRIACRDDDCFYASEPCWFRGETTHIASIESAVSIWMTDCQGLALRSDGLLEQWLDPSISCHSLLPPLLQPISIHGRQLIGSPTGFGESISVISQSGSFGLVTESGQVLHTRFRPSSPYLVPSERDLYWKDSWPPSVVGTFDEPAIDDAVAVASSFDATAILRRSGKIWAFGNKSALGIGSTDVGLGAGEVLGIDDAVAVAAGGLGTCAIRSDRSLWCWGATMYGELGFGGPPDDYGNYSATLYSPVQVPNIEGVRALSMTGALTCIVRGKNEVWCWGFPSTWAVPYRVTFR